MLDTGYNQFAVIKSMAGLLAVVNPVGAIANFIALTAKRSKSETQKTALITTVAMVGTLMLTSVAGEQILALFGISLASFRIGGGILILLIAIYMFHAEPTFIKHRPEETREALEKADIAIVPMAIPILSGPGAMTTVTLYAHQCQTWGQRIALWSIIILTGLVVYLALRLAISIRNKLGQMGANIITRLMGLILSALAVEFITKGLSEMFPGWVSGTR